MIDECCLNHIPYEILDKTPTENDWDYPVPFVRIDKKDKKAWILVDNKDAKGTWIPFGGAQDAIEKIITSCGEIIPQAGIIELIEGDGITFNCKDNKITIGLKIPITASQGGTGFKEYTLGDLLVGNQDGTLSKLPKGEIGQTLGIKEDGSIGYIDVLKKCNTEEMTENALSRWNIEGKCLKNTKTVQDDDGTTETTSTVDGELKQLIENLSSSDSASVVQHLRSLVKTMIRQEIKNKQIWDTYIDATSKSYIVRGENLNDISQKGEFFQILPNGVVSAQFKPKAAAYLDADIPPFRRNENYPVGSTKAFKIYADQDGTDLSAGHFFPGDGKGQRLYYQTNYSDKFYLVIYQFLCGSSSSAFSSARVFYDKFTYRTYGYLQSPQNPVVTLQGSYIFRSIAGAKIFFELRIDGDKPYVKVFDPYPVIENYIGIYMED